MKWKMPQKEIQGKIKRQGGTIKSTKSYKMFA